MAENKKDSFTFSDKIKNSKPAFNPFSKRVPSKIGSNGKPKKTLFERTRRDAPFFIAAAAALLMLPFLYKYSGSINEGVIIPPGSEDSVFDPERFGFDPSVEDPNGQIAQLTGRDPLSLIKGWGSEEPEEEYQPYDDFRVQDGLDDNYSMPPASSSPRTFAPAATRGAFQRQATKINELGSASMNLRGGVGGSFGRFGGASLKAAARENSAGAPRQGVKPVSLQPLRAAGSPSRSYFGQTGAAQARASRDAMGKANALQALQDAMFTPVKGGGFGGVGTGEFAPGGGAPEIKHTLDYKGITPWWWDMMKERAQEEWRWKFFLWRKNLVEPLIRALADLAVGFGCCIATASDDCSMGRFLGVREGYGKDPECCGLDASQFAQAAPNYNFDKDGCKAYIQDRYGDDEKDKKCPDGWQDGTKGGQNLGPIGARIDCLSAGIFGNGSSKNGPAQIADRYACKAVDTTHNFELQTTGKANKWHKYHLVVAKNYAPFEGGKNLCNAPIIKYNKKSGSGLGSNEAKYGDPESKDNKRNVNEAQTASKKAQGENYAAMGLNKEDISDGCVIYVAEGDVFDWNKFRTQMTTLLTQLYPGKTQAEYDKAFANIRLYFIEGLALKNKLSRGVSTTDGVQVRGMPVERLPMTYADFETNFILRKGNKSFETDKFKDKDRRYAKAVTIDDSTRTVLANDGKENAARTQCMFSDFQIKAVTIESPNKLEGVLTFSPEAYGNGNSLTVKMEVKDKNGQRLFTADDINIGRKLSDAGKIDLTYKLTADNMQVIENNPNASEIDVIWTAANPDGKESKDNTGYVGVLPEQEPSLDDDGTELNRTVSGEATTFAYRLSDIPADPAGRKALAKESLTFKTTPATLAADEATARQKVNAAAMNSINSTGNILADGAQPLYPTGHKLLGCLPSGDDNIVVQSDGAQQFMQSVQLSYNEKHKDSPIVYVRSYPSIANLTDAIHIALAQQQGATIPKAAVCQLGRILSTLGKDTTMDSQYAKNNKGKPYNNTFGAFATYIGEESARYPADTATDSSYVAIKKDGIGLNPRFYGYQPKLTSYEYHYGNYVFNGKVSSTFLADLQKRAKHTKGGDIFPLKELSLVQNVSWDTSANTNADLNNRRKYWQAYTDLFKETDGCDQTYGNETMSAAEALRYLEMVCSVGLNDKPRSGTQKTRSSGRPATPSAGSSVETGHNTSLGTSN